MIIPIQSNLYVTKLQMYCTNIRITLYYQEQPKSPLKPAILGTVKISQFMVRAIMD